MGDLHAELETFMRGGIDPAVFTHREHLRVGFEMLRRQDFAQTAYRYSQALRTMACRAGRPDAFHQTVTIAFLSLIAERLANADYPDFQAFAGAHPDLLDKSALNGWYPPERLASAAARRTFLLPGPPT